MAKELFIIFSICGTFLVTYFLFSFVSFYINTTSQFSEILEGRKHNLETLAQTFETFMGSEGQGPIREYCPLEGLEEDVADQKKLRQLSEWLFTLTKTGVINFSVLKYHGQTHLTTRGTSFSCGVDPNLEADYKNRGHVEVLKSAALRTVEVGNFQITLGIPILTGRHVLSEFVASIRIFFNDTLSLTLLLFIIVAYYLSDIIFLYSVIGKSDWRELLRARAQAANAKSLIRFVNSLLATTEELEKENIKLKRGYESGYLRHLNGKQSSTLKDVVYVELDWINHTPYIDKYGLDWVVDVRNQINHAARVVIGRYKGVVLEAKSDLVSYIMDCGNLEENKRLALACARDFFAVLDHFERSINEKDFRIKYRGAMVVSDFEFETTEFGYNLNSTAYYFASRLSKVSTSKDHHVVLMDAHASGVSTIAQLGPSQLVPLKGLGEKDIREISIFKPLDEVLAHRQFELLKYFRSESAMNQVLNYSRMAIDRSRTNDLSLVLASWPDFHLEEFLDGQSVAPAYLDLLSKAQQCCDEHILASLISLSKCLFSVKTDNQKVEEYFRLAANTSYPRLRANLVEAYNQLTGYQDAQWNRQHLSFDNNRVRGNAIIGACQEEVNDFYQSEIHRFLASKDEKEIASGLFVMGHLYRLFYIRNQIYFRNNKWFGDIPRELSRFASHSSAMVTKRAQEELNKISNLVAN